MALCCDTGTIDDESFNQACWTAVQNYMGDNCQYYIPEADASDEERETMVRRAVSDGADTVVCVGYLYGASLAWAAEQYPDIRFIAIDVTQADIGTDSIPANCYCITFKEEQAGYLAGYAITKDGFTKLGFLGGIAVPAVIRYGYGYIQGIDAAAQETGNPVEVNYFYGGQFYGDANITSRMEGWYSNGTEIVFACGGGIYTSALEAAVKNNGYVVGVDVDQNYIGAEGVADGSYSYNPFVTSAMKQLTVAVEAALTDIDEGNWSTIAATNGNFRPAGGRLHRPAHRRGQLELPHLHRGGVRGCQGQDRFRRDRGGQLQRGQRQACHQRPGHRQLHPVISVHTKGRAPSRVPALFVLPWFWALCQKSRAQVWLVRRFQNLVFLTGIKSLSFLQNARFWDIFSLQISMRIRYNG